LGIFRGMAHKKRYLTGKKAYVTSFVKTMLNEVPIMAGIDEKKSLLAFLFRT